MNHNQKLIFFIFILFSLSFTSAQFGFNSNIVDTNLGTYYQGQNIPLIQTCNCTFNNISSIKLGDGTILNLNVQMTNQSAIFYNYTLNGNYTTSIGRYTVVGVGDLDGKNEVWTYSFDVKGGSETFIIILLILFFVLTVYGISIKNAWVSLIGCFGLLPLGIYISFNGIGLFKNSMTNVLSYVLIAIGLGIGFESLMEITNK